MPAPIFIVDQMIEGFDLASVPLAAEIKATGDEIVSAVPR